MLATYRQIMRLFAVCLTLMIMALVATTSASLTMFEAGNYVVCIDKNMEINSAGGSDLWPILAGFAGPSSRDAHKNEVYEFKFTPVLFTNDIGLVPKPIILTIWKPPYDAAGTMLFTPRPDGDVVVGKITKIKTTVYTGDFEFMGETRTPYFVNFSIDSQTQCQIYDPSTSKDTFTKLLSGLDIIPKKDLAAMLPKLWTAV